MKSQSFLEVDLLHKSIYCRLSHKKGIKCSCSKEITSRLMIFGKDLYKSVYKELLIDADKWFSKMKLQKGDENYLKYFSKVNPFLAFLAVSRTVDGFTF